MGDACGEAKARLDRAETALTAASALVGTLVSEQSALEAEAERVETRFVDGSATAVSLDAEHQTAIATRGTKRAELQAANERLSAAKAEWEAAKADAGLTGARGVNAINELEAAKPAAEAADAAYQAAEAEMAAAEARAAKATAYLQTVANEREGVRVRRGTNSSKLEIARSEQAAALAEQVAAEAAVAAACP